MSRCVGRCGFMYSNVQVEPDRAGDGAGSMFAAVFRPGQWSQLTVTSQGFTSNWFLLLIVCLSPTVVFIKLQFYQPFLLRLSQELFTSATLNHVCYLFMKSNVLLKMSRCDKKCF